MPRVRLVVQIVILALGLPGSTLAQHGAPSAAPMARGGGGGGGGGTVAVTPDGGGPLTPAAQAGGHTADFTVLNSSATARTFTLTCSGSGAVTGCSAPASVFVPANLDVEVTVTYAVGAPGAGTLTLAADGPAADEGSWTVIATGPLPPTVALVRPNADSWDRSRCLVLDAEAAALQCGDLLLGHAMPALRTLGRDRAPTLVYGSHQAAPRLAVAADVAWAVGTQAPTEVRARLLMGGIELATASYAGSGWSGGSARQVVVVAPADGLATGAYPYLLEVQHRYGALVLSDTVAGTAAVVNRRTSPFGRGWWLAGLEELVFSQPAGGTGILRVGADGSAELYLPDTLPNAWVAPEGGFRDRITWNAGLGRYVRSLRHGVEVRYDALGHHAETVNRVGQVTRFVRGGTGRLDSIAVPPQGVAGTGYVLAWNAAGRLQRIADPIGRFLELTDSSGSVSRLVDPDGVATRLGYDAAGRLTAHLGRPGQTVRYEYAQGLRVTAVRVPYGPTGAATAVTVILPWDERGLGPVPADTMLRYTAVLGPRAGVPDDAKFWVDRWGAPTRIVDAALNTTDLRRGAPGFPALVSSVRHPDGTIDSVRYDARANVVESRTITTGTGALPHQPVTFVDYPASGINRDSPSEVRDALGRTTTYAYHPSLGLPTSVTDPASHVTSFAYITAGALRGQLDSVTEHGVETYLEGALDDTTDVARDLTTRFTYDLRGNLRTTRSPAGSRRFVHMDSAGRPAYAVDHYGRAQRWGYDALNRAVRHTRYTAARPHPDGVDPAATCDTVLVSCADRYLAVDPALGDSLVVTFAYGPVGLTKVTDPRGNDREYVYDARGLLWKELNEFNLPSERTYDEAGELIRRIGHDTLPDWGVRRDTVWVHRDRLGRDTATVASQRAYLSGQFVVPGDTVRTVYDARGRILRTWNRNTTVRWTWFGDGSVRTQTTQSGADRDSASYRYDAAGALVGVVRMSGALGDSVRYAYAAGSGRLQGITAYWAAPVNQARTVGVTHDALGRRRQLDYPNQVRVRYRYDAQGVLRRVVAENSHPDRLGTEDNFSFTRRLLDVDAVGQAHAEELWCPGLLSGSESTAGLCPGNEDVVIASGFDRLGQLVHQDPVGGQPEWYGYDASGNLTYRRRGDEAHFITIQGDGNRLFTDSTAGDTSAEIRRFLYTASGSLEEEFSDGPTTPKVTHRFFYYDGFGRLTGKQDTGPDGNGPTAAVCNLYGPLPYVLRPCGALGGTATLVHEGPNVAATLGTTAHWRFVQGGGVDDPVLGLYRQPGTGIGVEYAWITDGAGRHLAAGTWTGALTPGSTAGNFYLTTGGRLAGATGAATSYRAERQATPAAPELSHFRHRVYDQQTGRWLQEDPLGIAGGLNLYQFNGNNPVAYTDPFGLTSNCPPDCDIGDAADLAAGITPGVSTAVDLATATTGTNPVTREDVGWGGRVIAGLGLITPSSGGQIRAAGKAITVTVHAIHQAINRNVKPGAILDAFRRPLRVGPVKLDARGQPSQRIMGSEATVVQNPETGAIVTVNPTSTQRRNSALRERAEGE